MTLTKQRRPADHEAPPNPSTKTVTQTPDNPWYADSLDTVEWWKSTALSYAMGLQDGAQLALEEIAGVLIDVLGQGRDRSDRAEPIEALIRYRNQVAARGGRGWVA